MIAPPPSVNFHSKNPFRPTLSPIPKEQTINRERLMPPLSPPLNPKQFEDIDVRPPTYREEHSPLKLTNKMIWFAETDGEDNYDSDECSLDEVDQDMEEHPSEIFKESPERRLELIQEVFRDGRRPKPLFIHNHKPPTKSVVLELNSSLIKIHNPSEEEVIPGEKCDILITKSGLLFSLRPYLIDFLGFLNEGFEVFLYTSMYKSIAEEILEIIDPMNDLFDLKLYSNDCIRGEGGLALKTLEIFGNRNRRDLLIVDDCPTSWMQDLDNLVPISTFKGDAADEELLSLSMYLAQIHSQTDIRDWNIMAFSLATLFQLITNK